MGKRWNSEWKYYRFTKDDETKIRFRPQYDKDWYEKKGYKVEELKPKRYSLEDFGIIVKYVLANESKPLGTTDLWLKCLDAELLLTDKTFLKKLNLLYEECDWLELGWVGNGKTWTIRMKEDPNVEERYMLVFGTEGTRIVDTVNDTEIYAIKIVELLNDLYNENRELKSKVMEDDSGQ